MEPKNLNELEQEVFRAVAECRHKVLDLCELELGGSDRWGLFRRQLLKFFGSRGLESDIERLFDLNFKSRDQGGFCA